MTAPEIRELAGLLSMRRVRSHDRTAHQMVVGVELGRDGELDRVEERADVFKLLAGCVVAFMDIGAELVIDVGAGEAERVAPRLAERQPVLRIGQRLETDRDVDPEGGSTRNAPSR
jgi:hypothetical protein